MFQILHPVATKPDARTQFHKWALAATFSQDEVRYPETAEGAQSALKAEAEEWLSGFIARLGAVWPDEPADAIVRWQDVRRGDSVLLDDMLVTAEKVDVIETPWGDGTTFTAAGISYRMDNGVLAVSERHGDRYTAVRRAVPAEPAKEAGR